MSEYQQIITKANRDLQNFRDTVFNDPERVRSDFANLAVELNNQLRGNAIWELVPHKIGTLSMAFKVDNEERKIMFRRPGLNSEEYKQFLTLPITAIDEMMCNYIDLMQLADLEWVPVFTKPKE